MIKTLTKEFINNSMKLVETITYSNNTITKKIIDPKTMLPIDMIVIKK